MGHTQVCISLQTDNHASTPPLKFFYRPDALPAAQPTMSKHWRSQSWRRKERLLWEGFAEKKGFKPGMKEWGGDGWRERTGDRTDGRRTRRLRIGEISAWLMKRSPELIPQTRGSILEGTICYSQRRWCRWTNKCHERWRASAANLFLFFLKSFFHYFSVFWLQALDSAGSPVHILMLSIQAARGLLRLHAPGIVPCIISFSRQLPCFLMVWP